MHVVRTGILEVKKRLKVSGTMERRASGRLTGVAVGGTLVLVNAGYGLIFNEFSDGTWQDAASGKCDCAPAGFMDVVVTDKDD